jgi:hypothetical protein
MYQGRTSTDTDKIQIVIVIGIIRIYAALRVILYTRTSVVQHQDCIPISTQLF